MNMIFEELDINTDGGSRGNPGPAAIGVYAHVGIKSIFTISQKIGVTTNNVAEYTAVLSALEKIRDENLTISKLRFILDSELVVMQITGKYKIKQDHLLVLKNSIVSLVSELRFQKKLSVISFKHVLREENKNADKLVNQALDN